MSDDPRHDDPPEEPAPHSALPIVLAAAVVAVVGVLAALFLRPDDSGRLVRPDRLTAVGDDVVQAVALGQPSCVVVDRAQTDLAEEAVFVELVVSEAGSCEGDEVDIVAEVHLPEPIDDRPLRAGVGRVPLPCTPEGSGPGSTVVCAPAG